MTRPDSSAPGEPSLRLEWWDAETLTDNPHNWRRHPDKQLAALSEAIDEVGWAGALLYNERTQRLIDGHARKKLAKGKVPVLVGSWSEEQEKLILTTLDPISAMAEANREKLDALLREVQVEGAALCTLLGELPVSVAPQLGNPEHGRKPEDTVGDYADRTIKRVTLFFGLAEYDKFVERLDRVCEREGVETHTEAVVKLLDHYEANSP